MTQGTYDFPDAVAGDSVSASAFVVTRTSPGRELLSIPMSQGMTTPPRLLSQDLYSFLGMGIDNTQEEIILCATPMIISVGVAGSLLYK